MTNKTDVLPLSCVLLIDDDEITNFVNKKILLNHQLADHVHIFQTGEEALSFISENCSNPNNPDHSPDLVLLDVNMPVMDGFEFLQELKSISIPLRVILLTSSDNPRDTQKAASYLIQGYISKPLTVEKLYPYLPKNQ